METLSNGRPPGRRVPRGLKIVLALLIGAGLTHLGYVIAAHTIWWDWFGQLQKVHQLKLSTVIHMIPFLLMPAVLWRLAHRRNWARYAVSVVSCYLAVTLVLELAPTAGGSLIALGARALTVLLAVMAARMLWYGRLSEWFERDEGLPA